METDHSAKPVLATVVSRAALLLELMILASIAWYIPADRARFIAIFRDFDAELPSVTMLMLSIPDVAIWIAAVLLASLSCALQWRLRSKAAAAIFHLFVLVLCCVALVMYRELLYLPLSALMQRLQ